VRDHGGVATTTTCPHGLDPSTCLICATLSPVQTTRLGRPKGVPAGKAEVLTGTPQRRGRIGFLGAAVVALAVLFVVWLLIHLFWSLLRLVELGLVGVVCGVVGYRVGEFVGRHRR
jgi:hypothetical protein